VSSFSCDNGLEELQPDNKRRSLRQASPPISAGPGEKSDAGRGSTDLSVYQSDKNPSDQAIQAWNLLHEISLGAGTSSHPAWLDGMSDDEVDPTSASDLFSIGRLNDFSR
jgi:hypothetical protein